MTMIARLSIFSVIAVASAVAASRPNVLLIVSDDLNCNVGSYGHPVVQTPHIDRLAQRGVQFDYAFAQYPVCNPSRNSFLTGLRPDATGILDNSTPLRGNLPNVVTLPQCFRQHGYFTASIAKIFHVSQWDPRDPNENPAAWKLDDVRSWDFCINTKPTQVGLSGDYLYLAGAPAPGDKLNYRTKANGTDDDQEDGQAVRDAIGLMRESRERPFFIGVGFRRPHAAWVAPKRYFELYPLDSLRLPEAGSRDGVPAVAFTNQESNYGEPVEILKLLQGYLATTTFMDAQVGRLLAALEELGHADNTIVVLFGDHGFHLGEHGLWHKGTLFEESVRTPLVIYVPGAAGNGGRSSAVVELVDLFPTLADLCGLGAPEGLAGRSLRPFLEDPGLESTRPAFSQVRRREVMGRTVRTSRWRYTEWDGGALGAELCDHENDPREAQNLVTLPQYAASVASLRGMLHGGGG